MRNSKAQISTIDALFGLSGLLLALMLALAFFSLFYEKVALSIEKKGMETTAYYAMEEILSRGDPANWQTLNESSVNNYGVEKEMGVLDENKIIALNSTIAFNYSLVKERLGLSKYNFSLAVSDFYSRELVYSMGLNQTDTSNTLTIGHVSTLDNSLVLVQLKVFR